MEEPHVQDESPYSNREFREFFGGINKEIKYIRDDVIEIKAQTKKTNGRVNRLENWKWALIGGWIVITAIIVPIAVVFLRAYLLGKA